MGHHHHCRRADAGDAFEQKEKRNADERAAAEAKKLSFRHVEQHLAFHLAQILGDVDVGQRIHIFSY